MKEGHRWGPNGDDTSRWGPLDTSLGPPSDVAPMGGHIGVVFTSSIISGVTKEM